MHCQRLFFQACRGLIHHHQAGAPSASRAACSLAPVASVFPASVFQPAACRHYSSRPVKEGAAPEEDGDDPVAEKKKPVAAANAHAAAANAQAPAATATPKRRKGKTTLITLAQMHSRGEPISMMTAHDYPSAMMVDKAGIDMLLVGDSLAMVALGYQSTTSVTLEEMLHHCRACARATTRPFLVGDMPFGTYQISPEQALTNAIKFIKEGNMEAVKIEGGVEMAETARKIVGAGIPVLGHIGLTPQSSVSLGGFRVQGKTAHQAAELLNDAIALQQAGCFGIVLEAIPDPIAASITNMLKIPTIGIGAGPNTSGQVLVQLDTLGIFDRFVPKFCRQYAHLAQVIQEALERYHEDVKRREFPAPEHCYPIDEGELRKFYALLEQMKVQQEQKDTQ